MPFRAGPFYKLCAAATVASAGLVLAQGNLPQPPTPTIKATAREVLVPVIVTDKSGHYITSLDRDDFTVLEDGVPQKIVDFRRSAVTLASEATGNASTTKAPSVVAQARIADETPKRTYLICLDTLHSTFGDFSRVRSALKKFFAEQGPDDSQYALMALGLSLHVVVDSTRDPQTMLNALESKTLLKTIRDSDASNIHFQVDQFVQLVQHWCGGCQCSNPAKDMISLDGSDSCAPLKQQVESAVLAFPGRAYVTNRNFLQQLRQLVTAMASMPTRRTVVFVSDGFNRFAGQEFYGILNAFHVADANLKFNAYDLQPELDGILRLAYRYDVRFYTLDSRGLYTHADIPGTGVDASTGGVPSTQAIHAAMSTAWFNGDAMSQLARETGGHFFENTNDFLKAFRTAFADGREEYILAYIPSAANLDGRFRKISVEVKGKGLQVAAKAGYWATP